MAQTILPFAGTPPTSPTAVADVLAALPPVLREACDKSPFLAAYIQTLPIEEIGVPTFHNKLSRSMGNSPARNIIYPIKEGLFVHIYPGGGGARDHYIPIEPTTVVNIDHKIPAIDERLVAWAEELGRLEDKEAVFFAPDGEKFTLGPVCKVRKPEFEGETLRNFSLLHEGEGVGDEGFNAFADTP